jgi:signal transduction histidine kinase
MKLAAWAWCAISGLLAACSAAEDMGGGLGVVKLSDAQVQVSQQRPAWQPAPPDRPALAEAAWRSITMPLRVLQPAQDPMTMYGADSSDLHWLRFSIPRQLAMQPDVTVYLPRVHQRGGLSVYLGGRLVQDQGLAGSFTHFNFPLLLALPAPAPGDGPVELLLRFETRPNSFLALATPLVGTFADLRTRQQVRQWIQVEGPRLASACLLLLGLFGLLVGLRRRHEPQHLWFFALTVLFFLRCLHYHSWVEIEPDGNSGPWFWWTTVNSLAWITVLAVRMASAFHGLRYPRCEGLLWAMALTATLISLPPLTQAVPSLALGVLIYPLHMLLAALAVGLLVHAARRSGSGHTAALAAVLALNLLLGVHDWLLRLALIAVDGYYLLPYGGLAMFGVMLHAMASGYSRALVQAEQSAAVLDRKLAEREADLRESHERLRRVEREQVLTDERQRLMREMHDGLGSTLTSSLVAAQRGQLTADAMAHMLRESVDELRLSLDSLDPGGDDLLLQLANLRYRLAPRLEAAGITLDWQLHALPDLPDFSPGAAQNLLRMLQEALANVMKHAQATRVCVSAETSADQLALLVADNGHGFDATRAPSGRGLGNLRRRAQALGGQVSFTSTAQGTTLRIELPTQAPR